MVSAPPPWQFSGEFFENCNCEGVCPCLFSPNPQFTSSPTAGDCEVGFGFHIERGRFGDTPLDGLNAGLMARAPGPMGEGNWSVGLYLDERADAAQRDALQAIFTGTAGGVMSMLAPWIGTVLGVKAVRMTWTTEGKRRSLEIPGVAHMAVQAAPGLRDAEIWARNAHPFAPEGICLGVGAAGSTWEDYGMRFDNAGKYGHYAPITWSNQ